MRGLHGRIHATFHSPSLLFPFPTQANKKTVKAAKKAAAFPSRRFAIKA
jgi:hypothetical protein